MISAYVHDSSRLPTKSFKQNSVVVVPARGKASSNLLPSQQLRLLPEVSKLTKRSGSSRLGRSLQTQISPWKWLSFQCDCRHLAALAPNHLAGPEGWAHSLDTDEIVDRNFARMCMVRWVKLVFQTNELTEEKQLTCPRSRCCVTERWDWYKLKLDPAKSRVRLSSTGVSPRCPELAHETQLWSASNGLDSGWTMLCRMSVMSVMLMDMFLRFLYSERGLTRSDHFATASISWKHQKLTTMFCSMFLQLPFWSAWLGSYHVHLYHTSQRCGMLSLPYERVIWYWRYRH